MTFGEQYRYGRVYSQWYVDCIAHGMGRIESQLFAHLLAMECIEYRGQLQLESKSV